MSLYLPKGTCASMSSCVAAGEECKQTPQRDENEMARSRLQFMLTREAQKVFSVALHCSLA